MLPRGTEIHVHVMPVGYWLVMIFYFSAMLFGVYGILFVDFNESEQEGEAVRKNDDDNNTKN